MEHEFGNIGTWTRDKLLKVEAYITAYHQALKNQEFRLEYIDAFAGTGYVSRKIGVSGETLFDNDEAIKLKDFIDGSARVALQVSPPFDHYTFIEKHPQRCHELERLKHDFPHLSKSIDIVCGEANEHVQRLCQADWIAQRRRGVMFLDPYGTQVSWETIRMIAETQAIDLWILFPIGTINRLLNRNGRIIDGRKRRLDLVFGEDKWFDTFYQRDSRESLFPGESTTKFSKTGDPFTSITRYFVDRLKSVFAQVAENPLVMKNSSNTPIFLLCFASGNPAGAKIAVRIAQHILGKT